RPVRPFLHRYPHFRGRPFLFPCPFRRHRPVRPLPGHRYHPFRCLRQIHRRHRPHHYLPVRPFLHRCHSLRLRRLHCLPRLSLLPTNSRCRLHCHSNSNHCRRRHRRFRHLAHRSRRQILRRLRRPCGCFPPPESTAAFFADLQKRHGICPPLPEHLGRQLRRHLDPSHGSVF